MNRGQVTVGIGLAWAAITTVIAVTAGYFANASQIQTKISDNKSEIYKDITSDRERISKVEEAITTIKDSQLEARNDIKELLKRTPK